MKIRDVLIRLIGTDPSCPNEADVLAYSERRLSTRKQAQIERHFGDCHDCRQVLAFLGRECKEAPPSLTEEAVSFQTNRVLAYIESDGRRRTRSETRDRTAGFHVSYPRLASVGLVICALAVGISIIPGGPSAADAAMTSLRLDFKDGRRIEPRISGGFDHTIYRERRGPTRGENSDRNDVHLANAENQLKPAKEDTAAVDERLMLSRVWLARGTREAAKSALDLLTQLMKSGIETPEALNDTGVAYFQLDSYAEAVTYFSKALEKSPGYNEALFNRALAKQHDRQDAEARRDWQQFIDQSSDEKWKTEARDNLNKLNGD